MVWVSLPQKRELGILGNQHEDSLEDFVCRGSSIEIALRGQRGHPDFRNSKKPWGV